MPNWQTILPALAVPQARLLRRQRAFLAAAAALLAMLLLGWAVPGPEAPGFAMAARRLGMPALAMLPAVAGAGLIAHHLARLTSCRAPIPSRPRSPRLWSPPRRCPGWAWRR